MRAGEQDLQRMEGEPQPPTPPSQQKKSGGAQKDEFGGIDDAALFAIDTDAIAAQQQQQQQQQQQKKKTQGTPPVQTGVKDEFGGDEFGGIDDAALFAIDTDAIAIAAMKQKQKASVSPDGAPSASPPRALQKKRPAAAAFGPGVGGGGAAAAGSAAAAAGAAAASGDGSLSGTLQRYYGFDDFREGQREVVEAVLRGRDAAVFWATGQGKSLCYQVPALHTGRTAVVVSPLISLMQDQCSRLNALGAGPLAGRQVATYLGASQADPTAEARALRGELLLLYVTPEKLESGGFLTALAALHASKPGGGLCLVAVDEAHCVSSWGHDFRPAFRSIGNVRRTAGLERVPLIALTATAVPRVQADVIAQLGLRDPHVALLSFDRPNLAIAVRRKPPTGGFGAALAPLVAELRTKPHGNSTIVYAPTRNQVDEVAAHLARSLAGTAVVVAPYHAGHSPADREDAHNGFLVGAVQVIVATVAFGMGIDKPDTRRVVHWGTPKTVEEYYQQIGRAGRDGLRGECLMFANDSDFCRYDSDFYTKELGAEAKAATLQSLNALRRFAMDTVRCRRAALLEFFEEVPSFGERCGTCDNCVAAKEHAGDTERDFGPEARVVLLAVGAQRNATMTHITTLVGGGRLRDEWRYSHDASAERVSRDIAAAKAALNKGGKGLRRSTHFFREMLDPLEQAGFLAKYAEKSEYSSYLVYVRSSTSS